MVVSELAPPDRGAPDSALGVAAQLTRALALARRAEGAGVALALDEQGAFDLPPIASSTTDVAQVRAAAALYFASELEATQVLACVETLAGLGIGGALTVDLGASAEPLQTFWQSRNERASATERSALFTRLFGGRGERTSDVHGGAPNDEFEGLLIDLCEALYKVDESIGTDGAPDPRAQVRIRITAERLGANLSSHAGGVVAYMAREILTDLQLAVTILRHPDLQGAFGVRDVWQLVDAISSRYLHVSSMRGEHLSRGKAGMMVLSWLSDHVTSLDDTGVRVDDLVVSAAGEWLQSSLALSEAAAATAER